MKMKNKMLLIITLLLIPTIVFASNGSDDFPIGLAVGMEAFVSIHMSFFVLKPLSEILSKENSKKVFWTLFLIRVCILIFFDFFITPFIAIFDFIGVFIGAFIIIPICAAKTKTQTLGKSNQVINSTSTSPTTSLQDQAKNIELKCAKCNTILQINDKICPNCGEPFDATKEICSYCHTSINYLQEWILEEL